MGKNLNIQQLDEIIAKTNKLAGVSMPVSGWINAIRSALGMSARSLGERIGLSQPRIALMEKGEVDGSISIKTLKKRGPGTRLSGGVCTNTGGRYITRNERKAGFEKSQADKSIYRAAYGARRTGYGYDFREQSIKNYGR